MSIRNLLPVLMVGVFAGVAWGAAQAQEAPRVTGPHTHENISVFLLHGTSAPGPVPATLQEALADGSVEVHETGNVQELKIANKGTRPVFVQLGDILKGGRQDRVVSVSMLLEPDSGLVPIGAFCVERGRWAPRAGEDAAKFSTADALMPSREAKVAIVTAATAPRAPAPTTTGEVAGNIRSLRVPPERTEQRPVQRTVPDPHVAGTRPGAGGQGDVWSSVDKVQGLLAARLGTDVRSEKSRTSLQLSLENERLKERQAAIAAAVEPVGLAGDDVIGVVIAINGRISSADLYPSNGLFRKMWPKLVRSAATEGLATKPADSATAPALAVTDVARFLADAGKGRQSARELGRQGTVEYRSADTVMQAVARTAKGTVVHENYLAR